MENIYELLRSTERESVIGADFNIDLIKTTWQHLILSYVTISVSRTILTDIKTNNIYIELWSTWFSQKKKKIIIWKLLWKLLFRPSCCVCFVSRDFQVQKCTIFAHYSYQYQHWVSITKLSYYVYMLALVEVYEKKVHWWSPIPTISPKQTITSHLKWTHLGTGIWKYGGVKPVNGIPTLPFWWLDPNPPLLMTGFQPSPFDNWTPSSNT